MSIRDNPLTFPLDQEPMLRRAMMACKAEGIEAKLGITGGRLVIILAPGQDPTLWRLRYCWF